MEALKDFSVLWAMVHTLVMFLFLLLAMVPVCFEFPLIIECVIYLAVGMSLLVKGAEEKTKYMQRFVGQRLEMVPENCIEGYTEGYSENYIRVYVQGEMSKRPTHVCVERLFKDGVLATIDE